MKDAKIKMKFLENTIATDKCLRKSEWTYPLTFSLHFCSSWPHSPFHGPVTALSRQQGSQHSGTEAEGAERLVDQSEIPVASR